MSKINKIINESQEFSGEERGLVKKGLSEFG